MEKVNTISLKIPSDLDKVLTLFAKSEDRSKSSVIRKALQEYLEDQEDLQAGLAALTAYNANPEATISLEDLVKKYDL